MSVWDLLIGRTPGMKMAQFAERSLRGLDRAASELRPLEEAGRTVPKDAESALGGMYARRDIQNSLRYAETQFESAADTARRFAANGEQGGTSLWSAINDAESAQSAAGRLESRFSRFDARDGVTEVLDDLRDGRRAADRAVEAMNWARNWPESGRQQRAAAEASAYLRDGAEQMEDAAHTTRQIVRPYATFDGHYIGATENLAYAVEVTKDTAGIKSVTQETREAARQANDATIAARDSLMQYHPRQSTADAQKAVANARKAVADSQSRARTEPRPEHFTRNMWIARGALGAGVAGAAGGATYLILRNKD